VIFLGFIAVICLASVLAEDNKNETTTAEEFGDPFEVDFELKLAADDFCRDRALADPMLKIAIPYLGEGGCHFWWQCTAYHLKKHECQGLRDKILLHYDLYKDRCELPADAKCSYQFDEHEIIIEAIMEYYKRQDTSSTTEQSKP